MLFAASTSSASSSDVSTLGSLNHRLLGHKSTMKIQLDNYYTNRVYTSSSRLSGHVAIEVGKDTHFDKVQILLLGTSRTRVDNVHHPQLTSHTFLKLEMPIPEASYPIPRLYEAGRIYNIPFNFTIPSQLTINACNHNIDTNAVHENHVCLPPSMGSWGGKDDFSPEMAHVDYSIVARLLGEEGESGKRFRIMEASQSVRVLPAYSEQPPLDITAHDKLYKMSKTKNLRKSILSAKAGTITVSAKQPGAVFLSPDGASASNSKAQLELVFEPASSQTLPPTPTGVTTKVTALTYFSSGAINGFPNMGDWVRSFGADSRGSYPCTTSLKSTAAQPVKWQQHIKHQARRDSGYASDSNSDSEHSSDQNRRRGSKSSHKGASPIYHTTTLQVPLDLPVHKKMFIPSFHSCILSRVYILWITVSLSTGGSSSSINLALPLQVGVHREDASTNPTGLPSFEVAIEDAEADDHLRPRTLRVPDVEFERHALPGYADVIAGRTAIAN
ncbi:hypothetical protein JX265_012104 [Neoarthrinium moseri]|uniref:Arrestin n=1 Tax=Neoarthrinium moseri TaxID=1658444 RepID=A0A9Q0AJX0_9PEZI|nr:hypothetical protein JX266_004830 [Neoarthrinium moseri]KAI1855841.1 hypothetical protein JX265_012104 [Neoarthrinium moseri]